MPGTAMICFKKFDMPMESRYNRRQIAGAGAELERMAGAG